MKTRFMVLVLAQVLSFSSVENDCATYRDDIIPEANLYNEIPQKQQSKKFDVKHFRINLAYSC
jgi:hypothetical protein